MPGAKGHLNERPKEIFGKLIISPKVKRQLRRSHRKQRRRGVV